MSGDQGYRVVRFYFHRPGRRRTIIDRCTLAQAQEHCSNPETSASGVPVAWGHGLTGTNPAEPQGQARLTSLTDEAERGACTWTA